MLNIKDVEIQNIDHLGIVAGIVNSIELVEIINDLIGSEPGEKVSTGHVVAGSYHVKKIGSLITTRTRLGTQINETNLQR